MSWKTLVKGKAFTVGWKHEQYYWFSSRSGSHAITALKRQGAHSFKASLSYRDPLSKQRIGAIQMAQQVQRFAAKPDDLGWIPRAHMVEGQFRFL